MNELLTLEDSFDLDHSFTSSTASASTFASASTSSARSSLSLSLPSFSASTSLINPHPHSKFNSRSHWEAIRAAANLSKDGVFHLRHLQLLNHLGSGHLARVFRCRIKGSDDLGFALKVIDLEAAGKFSHVRTEAEVLSALDHPFLPTLYARMDASHYACFLIDYCPGGDLHSLLVRHPSHKLPLSVVRFFASEVLLALEYLHALGFVYRDLKPENVLIRSDGHIMLSDFDLCFSSKVKPRLFQRCGDLEFVAEPEDAYSRACVGTHEYLAPEIVSGGGHGNGVDWWAFGIFLYELVYGRTPFKGSSKESTLKNIMKRELRFPDESNDANATIRDLIKKLLVKDVKGRMGSKRGASEIKRHEFFEGVKWGLVRSTKSPVVVGPEGAVVVRGVEKKRGWWNKVKGCSLGSLGKSVWCKRGVKFGFMSYSYKKLSCKKVKKL